MKEDLMNSDLYDTMGAMVLASRMALHIFHTLDNTSARRLIYR